MVVNRSAQSSQRVSIHETRRKSHKRLSVLAVLGGAASLAAYGSRYLDKTPIHTSKLTGEEWLEELMTGSGFRDLEYFSFSHLIHRPSNTIPAPVRHGTFCFSVSPPRTSTPLWTYPYKTCVCTRTARYFSSNCTHRAGKLGDAGTIPAEW